MITTATSEHIEGIISLWQQAFGDSTQYINLFLENHAKPQNTLIDFQNHMVCGMLFILPCQLVFGHQTYRCAYLYSIATRKEYQGCGISTRLLEQAHTLCTKRGYDVCTLVPATPFLFDFYQKRGYTSQGYIKTLSVQADTVVSLTDIPTLRPISADEALSLRQQRFGSAYLAWDKPALDYIICENKFLGGEFYKFSWGAQTEFLSCVPVAGKLLIREFCGDELHIPQVTAALHRLYQREGYQYRLFHHATIGELTPFGMTHWLQSGNNHPFYLSHVLD